MKECHVILRKVFLINYFPAFLKLNFSAVPNTYVGVENYRGVGKFLNTTAFFIAVGIKVIRGWSQISVINIMPKLRLKLS